MLFNVRQLTATSQYGEAVRKLRKKVTDKPSVAEMHPEHFWKIGSIWKTLSCLKYNYDNACGKFIVLVGSGDIYRTFL